MTASKRHPLDMKLERVRVRLTERRYLFGVKVNEGGFLSDGGRVYMLDNGWAKRR